MDEGSYAVDVSIYVCCLGSTDVVSLCDLCVSLFAVRVRVLMRHPYIHIQDDPQPVRSKCGFFDGGTMFSCAANAAARWSVQAMRHGSRFRRPGEGPSLLTALSIYHGQASKPSTSKRYSTGGTGEGEDSEEATLHNRRKQFLEANLSSEGHEGSPKPRVIIIAQREIMKQLREARPIGDWLVVERIIGDALARPDAHAVVDLSMFNAAITAVATKGRWESASRIMGLMSQAGVKPNVVTYNSFLSAYRQGE